MAQLRKLWAWFEEAGVLLRRKLWYALYKTPPAHYLEYILGERTPIVIVPGVGNQWPSMKRLADSLSWRGHPVHVVSELRNHTHPIPEAARIVREYLEREEINDVVLVAHSKGGLVGKYLLVHHNSDARIRGVVAIATPFCGSKLAHPSSKAHMQELRLDSPVISALDENTEVNGSIISIFGDYDTHVRSRTGCRLNGAAANVEIPVSGHNTLLLKPVVFDEVHAAADQLASQ